jgi:hypothetical protein
VLRAAEREGWLLPLLDAHFTPCDQGDAVRLMAWLDTRLALTRLRWTNRRGRASHRDGRYTISLPRTSGTGFAKLRVGLVLHEAAHVLDRMSSGRFGHQATFRQVLRTLVEREWRRQVKHATQRDIYARHRGPYSLLVGRASPGKGGKVEQSTSHQAGPFNAEEAHEESRMLVNDPRENVTDVHVFSISEGQFTGAFYKRGVEYPSWDTLRANALAEEPDDVGRVELPPDEQPLAGATETALLQEQSEPVSQVDAPDDGRVPQPAVPKARRVRNVPPQEQAAAGTKRRGTLLGISADKIEQWPNSKGASIVREALLELGETGITASDLAKRLAAALAEAGVEFPASLISRLKQGGFIRVVSE